MKKYFGCIAAEDEEERKNRKFAGINNYRAANKMSAADWARQVNTLCEWTMKIESRFNTEFERKRFVMPWDAHAEYRPIYRGNNLNEATTFKSHYSRIVQFFSLRDIIGTW